MPYGVEGDFSEMGGYDAMKRLISHQPDAVFVASDMMAFGALRALREAGLAVPGDIAVVGFDDIPLTASSDPPLTTVRQSMYRLGDVAAKTLIDLINNPGRRRAVSSWPPSWLFALRVAPALAPRQFS